jgi:hypothetical protein
VEIVQFGVVATNRGFEVVDEEATTWNCGWGSRFSDSDSKPVAANWVAGTVVRVPRTEVMAF